MFGEKGLGFTTEAPGLGTPKEPKGKHKASGYGDLDTEVKIKEPKSNTQDSLGDKEAETSMPKKVKEMSVTPQNSAGVKKMKTPGTEKTIKLKENKEKRKLSLKQIDKKDKKGLALYKNTENPDDLYYYDGKELYSVVDGDRKGPSVRMNLFNITGLQENIQESKLRSLLKSMIQETLNEDESDLDARLKKYVENEIPTGNWKSIKNYYKEMTQDKPDPKRRYFELVDGILKKYGY